MLYSSNERDDEEDEENNGKIETESETRRFGIIYSWAGAASLVAAKIESYSTVADSFAWH